MPKAFFNYDTLKATVGSIYKGYTELDCVQVPPFKKTTMERTDEGGGWVSAYKVPVTKEYDSFFVIMKNNKPYGVLLNPHHQSVNISNNIYPITNKFQHKEINNFINSLLENIISSQN